MNCKYLIINAFALSGRVCTIVLFPGCRYALPRAMSLLPHSGRLLTGRLLALLGLHLDLCIRDTARYIISSRISVPYSQLALC